MFNVKTPKRTYYLVAENEADMNKWVETVCQVCGLKAQDDEQCQSKDLKFESFLIKFFLTFTSSDNKFFGLISNFEF